MDESMKPHLFLVVYMDSGKTIQFWIQFSSGLSKWNQHSNCIFTNRPVPLEQGNLYRRGKGFGSKLFIMATRVPKAPLQ